MPATQTSRLPAVPKKNDWGAAFVCNVIHHGLGEPEWAPIEVLLPQGPRS